MNKKKYFYRLEAGSYRTTDGVWIIEEWFGQWELYRTSPATTGRYADQRHHSTLSTLKEAKKRVRHVNKIRDTRGFA